MYERVLYNLKGHTHKKNTFITSCCSNSSPVKWVVTRFSEIICLYNVESWFHKNLWPLKSLVLTPFNSVQFSHSVVSDSLQSHELQHTRPPCPSPTPRVYSNPCPSSQWCHPTISSSVVPFSSCLSLSQHQGLFQWVSSSHQVAKVLEFQFHQSHQWTPRTDFL